ncbi:MAG: glycosyltransferase family 1 protein, partial [Pseudonocardia sp.]|nr:glycosyltransferase family 1 protein [Pseudonocardia sp.]
MSTHLVVPGDVDDPTRPSGGNAYDRQVRRGLGVEQIAVDGSWPRPDAALPDGATVLLDGLVACGVPEIVERHTARLDIVVLVHLPLGDEVGAADLVALERRALHAARALVATSPWTPRCLRDQHGRAHLADRLGGLGDAVVPRALARPAHDEQVAVAGRHPHRRTTSTRPEH